MCGTIYVERSHEATVVTAWDMFVANDIFVGSVLWYAAYSRRRVQGRDNASERVDILGAERRCTS